MKKYGVNDHMHEGPIAAIGGALLGGLIGGGGTMAGLLTAGGLMGAAIGGIGGTLLGGMMTPKMDFGSTVQPQAAPESAIPATPAATAIPESPATPGAAVTETPVDTTGAAGATPFNVGEAAPLTASDAAKGEIPKKRKGRMSTILTTPSSRKGVGGDIEGEEMELLGG